MTTVKEIYDFMNAWAPFDTIMPYDNVGLLVGNENANIKTVGICLDITSKTLKEAQNNACELMISHHPIIFGALKSFTSDNLAFQLASLQISAICAHTNLDIAKGGVNDTLAECLELTNIKPLADINSDNIPPMARIGTLAKPMSAENFSLFVKTKLASGGIKANCAKKDIRTVAVCGGAGADLLKVAYLAEADAFITADIKHHEWLEAQNLDITLIDGGHFATEQVIKQKLFTKLSSHFTDIKFIILQEKEPYKTI